MSDINVVKKQRHLADGANWLHHGLVTVDQVTSTFESMAAVVDGQNEGDPDYRPMSTDLSSSPEFQATLELVFNGRQEPNGYTDTVLHAQRRQVKAQLAAAQAHAGGQSHPGASSFPGGRSPLGKLLAVRHEQTG